MEQSVDRKKDRIIFTGPFRANDLPLALAILHQTVHDRGFSRVIFDFGACTSAFSESLVPLCVQALKLREAKISTDFFAPKDEQLKRLFNNANWAHLLAPAYNNPTTFSGATNLPATQFRNPAEQKKIVDQAIETILSSTINLTRGDLNALEWSINEIMDNVLMHSASSVGGLVQLSIPQNNKDKISYVVADAGAGIPKTLRQAMPKLTDDQALSAAIKEGVTRDKKLGQGNGLFGSYEICSQSRGVFIIESGNAKLTFREATGLHVTSQKIPYNGTVVDAVINLSVPGLLEGVLRFNSKPHSPLGHIDAHYEDALTSSLVFRVKDEAQSLGSRLSGEPIRTKIINLARMSSSKVIIDFTDVPLVSSSFADEVVGKLFLEFGAIKFMEKFELKNVVPTVASLVDKAIMQRLSAEPPKNPVNEIVGHRKLYSKRRRKSIADRN